MNTVQPPGRREKIGRLDPVALTALLTLKEALIKENYEICPSIIATALEFGATQAHVFALLEDVRRTPAAA